MNGGHVAKSRLRWKWHVDQDTQMRNTVQNIVQNIVQILLGISLCRIQEVYPPGGFSIQ